MNCHICSQATYPFAQEILLEKYAVQYFQCTACGFVQTEAPYWLEDAYSDAINDSDIGMISRNSLLSKLVRAIILAFFDSNKIFLDYGGGYGIFVRMMRDYGFNFYLFDKFCENIFAKGFSIDTGINDQYELITAFEVFEHLINPIGDIEHILKHSKSILFSTTLLPESNPKPGEWWYYGTEHGQHISLYSRRSLLVIAERFDLNLYSDGCFLHLLTNKKISSLAFKVVSSYKVASVIGSLLSRRSSQRSLLLEDYHRVTGKRLS